MNNKIKKIAALSLCAALLFGLCPPLAASAAEAFEWLIEPTLVYEEVYYAEAGVWFGYNGDRTDILSFADGDMNVIPTNYSYLYHFSPALLIVREGANYGVIDTKGNVLLPAKYDKVDEITDTLFRVGKGNNDYYRLYGIVDTNGNEIVPIEYNFISLTETLFVVGKRYADFSWHYGVIDANGNEILPIEYDDLDVLTDTRLCVGEKYSYGYGYRYHYGVIDINGNEIIPQKYSSIDALTDTLLLVCNEDGNYGIIDINGNEVIPLKYDYIHYTLSDTLLIAEEKDENYNYSYSIIDINRSVTIPLKKYNDIYLLTDTLFVVEEKDENYNYFYGVIDINGNEIVPPKYSYIYALTDTLICVIEDGFYGNPYSGPHGVVDINGNEIIAPKYSYIEAMSDTLFVVEEKDENYNYFYGVIDINGNEVLPIKYEELYALTDKLLAMLEDYGHEEDDYYWYGIIDINGEAVSPDGYFLALYESYETPEGLIVMMRSQDGLFGVAKVTTHDTEYDYEIGAISISNASGESLAEIPQNEAFRVNVEVSLAADKVSEGNVIVAVYGADGALIYTGSIEAAFAGEREKSFSFDISAQPVEIGEIKAFVWHDISDPQPLAKSKTL